MPSVPATPPVDADVDDGCGVAPADPAVLSDGQVALTIPDFWTRVDTLPWLACSSTAASTTATASVTIGLSSLQGSTPQAVAEQVWAVALLDAGVSQPLTMTSANVQAQDMPGWMVSGTVEIAGQLDELTVIALASGEQATVVVTSANTVDEPARQGVAAVLATVRRA